jgi:hypothetical protein
MKEIDEKIIATNRIKQKLKIIKKMEKIEKEKKK